MNSLTMEPPPGLNSTWEAFVRDCEKTFPKHQLSQSMTIMSFEARINAKVRPDTPSSQRTARYFMRSLTCISKASGIIFRAAAIAFPPADLVGNAICLVMDAVVKVHGAFSDLEVLVERMSAFLETLKVHLENEKATGSLSELCNVCEKVLQHFVRVLEIVFKLSTSKRERFKAAFKIFTDDNEIREALDRMETVITDFTRMEVAVILQTVSGQAKDLGRVVDGMNVLVDNQTLATIEKTLSLHGYGKVGEKNRSDHVRYSNRALSGTGQWLIRSPEFNDWMDGNAGPVFPVMEVRGSGKTMLTNRVACHLQDNPRPGFNVAYFYSHRMTTLSVVGWALRNLIWQLVETDPSYAKMVERMLKEVDISTPLVIWKRFLMDLSRNTPTRILLLDGFYSVDARAGDFLARMVQDVSAGGTSIRLFLTGQPGSTYQSINKALRVMGHDQVKKVIKFAERDDRRNAEDIELLVKDRLNDAIWTAEDQALVASTMINMLNSNNLFDDLFSNIDDLNKSLTRTSLRSKLQLFEAKFREAYIDTAGHRVDKVNRNLGPEQIQELNTILPWVIVSGGSCRIGLINEVIALKNLDLVEAPSITKRLDLYSPLFGAVRRGKRIHFWGNIDVFGYMAREHAASTASSVLRQDAPPQHEVELMRSFLKTFCKADVYEKFGFEEFFNAKLPAPQADEKSVVRLEMEYCRVSVVVVCFDALWNLRPGRRYRRIHEFSRDRLAELLEQIDLETLDVGSLRTVSGRIVRFVSKPCLPRVWRRGERKCDLEALCKAMSRWLQVGREEVRGMFEGDDDLREFVESDEPVKVLISRNERAKELEVENEDAVGGAEEEEEEEEE